MLLPEELGFLKYLRAAKVAMNEYEFPDAKIADVQVRSVSTQPRPPPSRVLTVHACVCVQGQLERLVDKNYYLNRSAKDAYRSYLLSYASHSLKHIFNVSALDLAAVAKGFGFSVPPRVNLNIRAKGPATGAGAGGGVEGDDSDGEIGAEGRIVKRGGGGGFGSKAKRMASAIVDPKRRAAALTRLQRSTGHTFSATNPYGKRDTGDKRQFAR